MNKLSREYVDVYLETIKSSINDDYKLVALIQKIYRSGQEDGFNDGHHQGYKDAKEESFNINK